MTITATVKNHSIELPPDLLIADGTEVTLILPEQALQSDPKDSNQIPTWTPSAKERAKINRSVREAIEEFKHRDHRKLTVSELMAELNRE